ncbi:MAG: hypothetical protein DME90_02670 [Verrucomicrobia bacterium]|nr:MAG: hypothetical protein DME90_02670 [Verrucomicrobiota bacterium]
MYCPKSGARLRGNVKTTADYTDLTDEDRILWKRSFRRAAESPSRTGIYTRAARAPESKPSRYEIISAISMSPAQ